MAPITQIDTDVSVHFFEPLREVYPKTEARYVCRAISDLDYAVLGTLRCMSHAKTGHEFLQHHIDHGREGTSVDHFFKALKSGRRLTNLTSLNAELGEVMRQKVADPFQGLAWWAEKGQKRRQEKGAGKGSVKVFAFIDRGRKRVSQGICFS